MCTVSYVPNKKGFVFTSNRDEQATRKTITPAAYDEDGVRLFYPKDEVAGGTWIGVSEYKRLVCLLNGGFVYHNPATKFPKSRGIVVKKILTSDNLQQTLNTIELNGVAPFTLIVIDWSSGSKVFELVWCKEVKKITELKAEESCIWSSSTLYTDEMKQQRKEWFNKKVVLQDVCSVEKVLEFHQSENLGCQETSPKMKRSIVETVSTTMIVKDNDDLSMQYHDYVQNKELKYFNLFESVNA